MLKVQGNVWVNEIHSEEQNVVIYIGYNHPGVENR